jgi:hypothetical protein
MKCRANRKIVSSPFYKQHWTLWTLKTLWALKRKMSQQPTLAHLKTRGQNCDHQYKVGGRIKGGREKTKKANTCPSAKSDSVSPQFPKHRKLPILLLQSVSYIFIRLDNFNTLGLLLQFLLSLLVETYLLPPICGHIISKHSVPFASSHQTKKET